MVKVFVYGELMKDRKVHYKLGEKPRLICKAKTQKKFIYERKRLHEICPCITKKENEKGCNLKRELYDVNSFILQDLDKLEIGSTNGAYKRVKIKYNSDDGISGYAFIYQTIKK